MPATAGAPIGHGAPAASSAALNVALGNYPHTRSLCAEAGTGLDFAIISPINRAFAPMVRDGRYDISEMALMTFLQAKAAGRPLALLPVTLAARFQERALLCRTDDVSIGGPADLSGKRVGVRAYSQTTGIWVRGVLADSYGVACDDVRWVTFEDAHVSGYVDPPWTERAAPGQDLLTMLRAGQVDAVIVGNEVPDDPGLRTVFPDPEDAAARFRARYGFMPVNHVVTVRTALLTERPELVEAFLRGLLRGYGITTDLPVGRDALDPVIELALRFMTEQRLLDRPLTIDKVWDALPRALLSIAVAQ